MKLNKIIKRKKPLGLLACCGVLGLLTVALLCPTIGGGEAQAAEVCPEGSTPETCTATKTAGTTVKTILKPTIGITLADRVDVEVVPMINGSFSASAMDLTVSTNDKTGLKVLLNGVDGSDLVSTNAENTDRIRPVDLGPNKEPIDAGSFGTNTWGAAVVPRITGDEEAKAAQTAAVKYKNVDISPVEMLRTQESSKGNNDYSLVFGTKVNTSIASGIYEREVLVSAVANGREVSTITSMSDMQDMTKEVCDQSMIGETARVTDSRDGNLYWIAKMKDNRCWMTQNLALTFGDGTTSVVGALSTTNKEVRTVNALTSGDSNLAEGVTWSGASTSYKMVNTEYTIPPVVASPSQTDTRSWNYGKWVHATPLLTTNCGDKSNSTNFSACTSVNFVDVSDPNAWSTKKDGKDFTAFMGNWNGVSKQSNTLVAIECTTWSGTTCKGGYYDAHYLIGNYYQFNAATAGTGATVSTTDAPSSICPKGWVMPTAGTDVNSKSGSFYNLLNQYGVASALSGSSVSGDSGLGSADGAGVSGYPQSALGFPKTAEGTGVYGNYNVAGWPLSFVRSGQVYLPGRNGDTFLDAGVNGNYWSSRGVSSTYAYNLLFYASAVAPSGSHERYRGYSLRCLNDVR